MGVFHLSEIKKKKNCVLHLLLTGLRGFIALESASIFFLDSRVLSTHG